MVRLFHLPRFNILARGLIRLRWKLKLSPGELPTTAKKYMTANLPKGSTLQDVFADFIRYLFDSAKAFIQESEPMGKDLWERIQSSIDLVLSHPNGWEGREQEFLRKSVVQASLFTEEEALSRVSFVTEGEATFNFCVTNTNCGESLEVLFLPFDFENTFSPSISSPDTSFWSSMPVVELSTSVPTT
jgi:hypothetical protein